MTPDTGPFDANVDASAVSALLEKIGPAVLVTHSHAGELGWLTAIRGRNLCAIVSYEPGSGFPFSDPNNLEVADLMSSFLRRKGLD